MKNPSRVLAIASMLVSLGIALVIASCGDTGTNGEVKSNWTVNAVLSTIADDGQTYAFLALTKDNAAHTAATISLEAPAGDTIPAATPINLIGLGDGTYRKTFAPSALRDTTNIKVKSLVDQFQFSFQLSVPDSFSAAIIDLADNRVLSSTQQVQVRWTSSKFAEGYFIVVLPAGASNTSAIGYKRILRPGDYTQDPPYSSAMIPRETFRSSQGDFKTGAYNVWVAAYHDNPINDETLPFILPVGFVANVDRVGVTGQIGAIYIARVLALTAVAGS